MLAKHRPENGGKVKRIQSIGTLRAQNGKNIGMVRVLGLCVKVWG